MSKKLVQNTQNTIHASSVWQ